MQVYADAPSRRRLQHRLRLARLEAQARARRGSCDGCQQRRLVAQVDPINPDDRAWYCLVECWPFFAGMRHGEQAAAGTLASLITREIDRVFAPSAIRGWPRYRCDGCGTYARAFIGDEELAEMGWRAFGRDAHLCHECAPEQLVIAA